MAKPLLRKQAILLRLRGNTYGQIKRELGLSKSTLSDWLRNLPLTQKQQEALIKNKLRSKDIAIERYRLTRQKQRLERLERVFQLQKDELLPLSEKELLIAGLFLYWGEGSKHHGHVSISNTDPRIIKFAIHWMINALKIPKEKLRIGLHLYKDMDISKQIEFWSNELSISKEQFNKPYIKKTNREGLTYKSFGHGTCNLYWSSVVLSERIVMSLKAVAEYCGAKSELFWYN